MQRELSFGEDVVIELDVSSRAAPIKRTAVERQVNLQIVFLFAFLLALSLGSSIGSSIRAVSPVPDYASRCLYQSCFSGCSLVSNGIYLRAILSVDEVSS